MHVNHPTEIDGEVARAFGRLADAGIPLLAQTVLLRGVNDRADVLAELFERLADLRVMPYYLHQLDRVAGAAHFEVPEPVGRRVVGGITFPAARLCRPALRPRDSWRTEQRDIGVTFNV